MHPPLGLPGAPPGKAADPCSVVPKRSRGCPQDFFGDVVLMPSPRSPPAVEAGMFMGCDFFPGLPEELRQQRQPARGAGAAGGGVPGPLHHGHQGGGGGNGTCAPVLVGGHRAASDQRRDGPTCLRQRSVSRWVSLGTNLLQGGRPSKPAVEKKAHVSHRFRDARPPRWCKSQAVWASKKPA